MTYADDRRLAGVDELEDLRKVALELGEQLLERDLALEALHHELRSTYDTRIWKLGVRYTVLRRRLAPLARRWKSR